MGGYKWGGGFRGRPGLLEDLIPTIRAKHAKDNPNFFQGTLLHMRTLFRFLDAYERVLDGKGVEYQSVERLHQLTGAHLDMMSKPGPDEAWVAAGYSQARGARTLILDAIHNHDLPDVHASTLLRWSRLKRVDPPTQEEVASLIRFLRSEVLAIFVRWRRADRLASAGRNLLDVAKRRDGAFVSDIPPPTEADAHATYRALIERTGHPFPNSSMLRQAMGHDVAHARLPRWWPHYTDGDAMEGRRSGDLVTFEDLAMGLYPNASDVNLCSLLCLGRSAWNPSTLFSIDVNNWHSQYDEEATWVFAPKGRSSGAYQYTVSRTGERTSVFAVISALIERTAALRTWLSSNRTAHPTPDIALRSPWFGVIGSRSLLFVVEPGVQHHLNRHLKNAIARHNESPSSKMQVRSMSSGDFRDVAAAWVYRNSRYSMWVTMILLGHKHPSTTRIYLDTRAARQESHLLVKSVMDDVFEQIDTTQHWDPTFTRAKVEGVEMPPAAVARLHAYRSQRTYDGSICSDPFHPPRHIDPTHPHDGKKRCIQGHRCVASKCPRAKVFRESLPWLARRTAELEWNEQRLGTVRFSSSTDAQDLIELRKTLEQWPIAEVEKELDQWRAKLRDGTHRPLRLAGQH